MELKYEIIELTHARSVKMLEELKKKFKIVYISKTDKFSPKGATKNVLRF